MFFKTPAHRARFLAAIQQGNWISRGRVDADYGAALYILTSDLATYERAKSYISRNGIKFDELLAETDFSHGYLLLVCLAGNLFNGHTAVSPVDFSILDAANFEVAMEAQRIHYERPRIEDFGNGLVVEGGE